MLNVAGTILGTGPGNSDPWTSRKGQAGSAIVARPRLLRFLLSSIVVAAITWISSSGIPDAMAEDQRPTLEDADAQSESTEGKMFSVYVSLGQGEQIVHYHLDATTGKLTRKSTLDVPGTPGAQVSSSDRSRLYVAMRSIKSVSMLRIDPDTGDLSLHSTTPAAENPVYLALDPTGRHLLMSSYNGNLAGIYPVQADGSIDRTATTVFETEQNPHSIMLDPSGRHGYIPNTGSDSIWQLDYDATRGILTPKDPDRVPTEAGAGPRHFFFHPTLSLVYFVNEKNSSVTAYRLNQVTGTLEASQTLSTLPDSFRDNNTCADIEVTPCGRFLYASNRGHDSLAGYAIDAESGELTMLGNFATEQTPRSFNIDPTGKFLVAAGQGNGRLASYRILSDTGRLEPLETLDVGADPAWVQIVSRPESLSRNSP